MLSRHARFVHQSARVMTLALVVTGLAPVQLAAQTSTGSARDQLREITFLQDVADSLIDEFSKAMTIGITSSPISTSSAGFTYRLNDQTGERTLRSQSFGPLFVERPLTSGRGVLNGGITFSRVNFSKFLGTDIRSDGIVVYDRRDRYLADNRVDFNHAEFTLSPTVTTARASLSYGVTDSFDVGVVVPVSRFEMTAVDKGAFDFRGEGLRGGSFGGVGSFAIDYAASKVGVGDVSLRAKYAFGVSQPVAIAVDVRLPTGDDENFLGTGKASARVGVSGARALSSVFTLTANGGYEAGGVTNLGFYRAAVDAALLSSKKLTVSAEFDGQYLSEAATGFAPDEFTYASRTIAGRSYPVEGRGFFQGLSIGGVNLVRAAIGAKYNLFGRALVSAGVIFPLNDAGLSAPASAFLGFDLSLGGR